MEVTEQGASCFLANGLSEKRSMLQNQKKRISMPMNVDLKLKEERILFTFFLKSQMFGKKIFNSEKKLCIKAARPNTSY